MFFIGEVLKSNFCGDVTITDINGCNNVVITFNDTGFEKTVASGNIKKGVMSDPYSKKTFGVGFKGEGIYKASVNRKHTPSYSAWKGMMQRCYSSAWHKRHPSYIGATVCDEWHNFQNFAEWYRKNYIDGFELDKDIKVKGNRVYSPETCMFVSKNENVTYSLSKVWDVIINGESVKVRNLKRFCIDNCLPYRSTREKVKNKEDITRGII